MAPAMDPSAAPLVAVTLRPHAIEGSPPRYVQNQRYVDAVVAAGGVPLGVPPLRDERILRALYDRCDALLLPGGPDVEPQRYGEQPRDDCNLSTAPDLDAAEFPLLHWALDDGKPVLAICRGIQVLNVALGGTLWQDITVQGAGMHGHDGNDRDAPAHEVSVVAGTALRRALGEAAALRWNSLHHQALRDLGPGLAVSARAEDGLVEGVELPGRPVIGVQCHPEEMARSEAWAAGLFAWLVDAARSAASRR